MAAKPTAWHAGHGARPELRLFLHELVASLLWVFLTVTTTCGAHWCLHSCSGTTPAPGMCPPPTVVIQIGLTSGFAAAVSVSMSAFDSGGGGAAIIHPFVACALAARGRVSVRRLSSLVGAEALGAVLGVGLVLGVVSHGCVSEAAGEITPGVPVGSQLLLLAVANFTVCLLHFWAQDRLKFMGVPILIGLSYVAITIASRTILGGHLLNPLLSFGLLVVGAEPLKTAWVAIVGSLCGACLAIVVDLVSFGHLFLALDDKPAACKGDTSDSDSSDFEPPEVPGTQIVPPAAA